MITQPKRTKKSASQAVNEKTLPCPFLFLSLFYGNKAQPMRVSISQFRAFRYHKAGNGQALAFDPLQCLLGGHERRVKRKSRTSALPPFPDMSLRCTLAGNRLTRPRVALNSAKLKRRCKRAWTS